MNINQIKHIIIFINKYGLKKLLVLIPLDIISSILEVFSITLIIPLIYTIIDEKNIDYKSLNFVKSYFQSSENYLYFTFIIFILVFSFFIIISISNCYLRCKFINQIGKSISDSQFSRYVNSEYILHKNLNSRELSKNLMTEVPRFTNNVLLPFVVLISRLVFLVIMMIIMLIINFTFTIILSLFFFALYFLIFYKFKLQLKNNGTLVSNSYSFLSRLISESLIGLRETKLYNLEDYFISKYSYHTKTISSKTAMNQFISILPKYIIEFILFIIIILSIMVLNYKDALKDFLPIISFFLFAGYRLLPSIQQIYSSITLIRSNFASLEKLSCAYKSMLPDTGLVESNNNIPNIFKINFENVSLSLGGYQIFDKFTCSLRAPSFIGLIGESGSGKSTLINLLLKSFLYYQN